MNVLERQEYSQKPLYEKDVCSGSSKAIFEFMTTDRNHVCIDDHYYYPLDVDDFERNRALLLWYPEWKIKLKDMSILSDQWSNLVNNWNTIEKLYDEDYEKYGNGKFYNKNCCSYIRSLVK